MDKFVHSFTVSWKPTISEYYQWKKTPEVDTWMPKGVSPEEDLGEHDRKREELQQKPSSENGNKLYIFEGENISLCGWFRWTKWSIRWSWKEEQGPDHLGSYKP